MPLPKKSIKKNIPLTFPKTLYPRREELLEKINKVFKTVAEERFIVGST